ncbi:MAG: mechanosensitive ion channel family protein [Gemmatimonadaceae bacterium]
MFLDRTLYGNSVRAWLVAALAFAVALGALSALRWLLTRRFAGIAGRTPNAFDDLALELARRTRVYFLVAVALVVAVRFVALPPRIADMLDKGVALVVLIQAARWATGAIAFYVARHVERRRGTAEAANLWAARMLGFAASVAVWTIILVAVLDNLGFDVTTLVTGLGIGGIAIALAVQNILGDVFAALAIVLDKPFVVGDFISVDTFSGTVEQIGLKTTRIRSLSGEQIIFANNDLLKGRIRNYKRLYERRNTFTLDVTYDTPPEVVARIPVLLREIVEAQHPVRFDRSHFSGYGDSALRFETVYFVLDPDYNRHMDIQQAIFLGVLERFRREGIAFAFPTRTVIHKHEGEASAAEASA